MNKNNHRYYFAYGSNMDLAQMKDRCPDATPAGTGSVDGYRFLINSRGVATIVPKASRRVHGVLWDLTAFDEKALDGYEGVDWGYYEKVAMDIVTESGLVVSALVYMARDTEPGIPRDHYMELIVAAAKWHRLSDGYVSELESWLKA